MAIAFKGVAGAGSDSTSLPSHVEDDCLIMVAMEDGSGTVPTIPSPWIFIVQESGDSLGIVAAYHFATSSSEVSGTWTGADKLVCLNYSGVDQADPIGDTDQATANDTTAVLDALTLEAPNTSTVIGVVASRDSSQTIPTPSGMTGRVLSTVLPPTYKISDIIGAASFTSRSVTVDSARWKTLVFELKAAATTIDGTLTKTLDAATVASSATVGVTGSLDKALAGATVASAGTIPISGAAAITLDATTVVAVGDVPTSGVANFTLDGAAVASAGTVAVTGSLAKTLADAIVEAEAAVGITGSLTKTLDALVMASAGTQPITGSLTKTLADFTVSASESIGATEGELDVTLADATVVATGLIPISGSLAKTLAAATVVAAAEIDIAGSLAKTLGAVTLASAGTIPVVGSLAKTLGGVTTTATGVIPITGEADFSLAPITVDASDVEAPEGGAGAFYPTIQMSLSLSLGL